MSELTLALPDRFLSKMDWQSDGCILWTGVRDAGGYGRVRMGRQMTSAHRAVYEMYVGPVPAGLELDHTCGVRHCVNPEHLEPVTHRENVLRGNGVAALCARKTHCTEGHPLSGENLVMQSGRRVCRICRRVKGAARMRRWRAARATT